jgi:murein DD-endopeptidase MepM/ murein hydrolase activator NlpD
VIKFALKRQRKLEMNKFWLVLLSAVFIICIPFSAGKANAQSTAGTGPVYIIQEGDALWDIAYRFHVSQEDLANANGIVNANQITIGQRLVIPGLEGIQGVLTTEIVPFGETLSSMSLRYHLSIDILERLNHLTSPNELYVGYSLVILQNDKPPSLGKRVGILDGQSFLEMTVLNNTDPWTIITSNHLSSSSTVLPVNVLRVPGKEDAGPGALPTSISSVSTSGFIQGQTGEIEIDGVDGLVLHGSLMEHPLNFSLTLDNHYFALQGVHAMAQPGLYPMGLTGSLPNGSSFVFSQDVLVYAGDFIYDIPLSVDPATLDPETTVPEDSNWYKLSSQVSPDKLWDGEFSLPVQPVFAECYASRFGSRRSYNGSDYIYFHTGIDYCGQVGDPIYAAASGVVVFAGSLTVRGNATMIDHGWGVYTAYMHQSEILVNVGDHVEQGQLIGKVGNTGRVEGPHLHFEVLVGGVQVDPLEWLNRVFP